MLTSSLALSCKVRAAAATLATPTSMCTAKKRPFFSSAATAATTCRIGAKINTTICSTAAPSNVSASSLPLALTHQRRHQFLTQGLPSAVLGRVKAYAPNGFVSPDIKLDISNYGGQFARGYFAARDLPHGREIIRVPAFATYVGDEPQREQVFILTQEMFRQMVEKGPQDPYTQFVISRVFTLMCGGHQFFVKESDLQRLIESVPNAGKLIDSGEVSAKDVSKLPQQIEFNRYDVDFRGKRGICLFPEAAYFNHSCIPNVEITIDYDTTASTFVLSARVAQPVSAGEELFISYIPDNDLPLSRFMLAMRKRWGFECMCNSCRSRGLGAVSFVVFIFGVPLIYWVVTFFDSRFTDRSRKMQ